jgi:hypothetical protein
MRRDRATDKNGDAYFSSRHNQEAGRATALLCAESKALHLKTDGYPGLYAPLYLRLQINAAQAFPIDCLIRRDVDVIMTF